MKTKRFLSILLSLVLVLGMLPGMSLTASAEGNTKTITPGTDDAKTGTGTMTITLKIKDAQTITASDVTATYGDTDKSVSGTTTGDGAISYSVKSGDAVTVDENTGALTIVKAGSAVITVTAAETSTYAQATKDVTVTVNTKAMTVSAEDVNVTVDGQPHGITVNVTDPASGATVKYGTEVGTYNLDASPTQTEAGELTVYYQVTADNYTTYTGSAKVTVSNKSTQTINASDVTATYGDTDKKVEATTNGNGAISYAVKDGSADYIDVDASTGALTIKKVGTATVVVTAAETGTYAQATKEVTVTINKANAVAATVTANNRTYDGTEKPLINVDDSTLVGGTMYYAVTTENKAPTDENLYTTSIPTATNAGTYYVWYKAVGDGNHSDSTPKCVTVVIESYVEKPDDWNLFEDDSVHEYPIRGIHVAGTVENSNARSKAYYDAKISGSTITVRLTGNRKKAAKAENAVLEFKLGAEGVVEYVIPVSYVKPVFKLSTASATIRQGTERELKTTLLVKGMDGGFEPYDMKDAEVSGTGFQSVAKGADGSIVIKANAAGKGNIKVSKKSWDSEEPVSLAYKVNTSKKDVLKVDIGNQTVIDVNSKARGQVLSFDILLNGSAPEKGAIKLTDKNSTGMATVSDNGKLIVSYKDGVRNGRYTITLEGGDAKVSVPIQVNSKDLNKCIKLKVQRKLNIVTKQSMVVVPNMRKNLNGDIEAVGVEEEGFRASLDSVGNIVIGYDGNKYTPQNLKIGTLTLKLKIGGVTEPVTMQLKNVKASKALPSVKAAAVIIPKDAGTTEDRVIGTANIVSYVKLANGRMKLVEPQKVEIEKQVNVKAKVNEKDKTEIDIESISKKTGSIRVKLTYDFDLTKKITIKVKKAAK